jgi:hypothetical protein
VSVTFSWSGGARQSAGWLAGFRGELYRWLPRRGDALSELADAVLCGPGQVTAWPRVHPKLQRACGGWHDHPPGQDLPVIEGTLIRLRPARPVAGQAGPMWLWASTPDPDEETVAVLWQACLRRSELADQAG